MEDYTVWYGFHLLDGRDVEIVARLIANRYTFYTNRKDIIFVCSEEAVYVSTILKEHRIGYELL